MRPAPIPAQLGSTFSVEQARACGMSVDRLRASDLESPFRGVRAVRARPPSPGAPFETEKARELALIRMLSRRMLPGQFFCHRSAAMLWNAPVPHLRKAELHLGVLLPQRAPRVRGVIGHSFSAGRAQLSAVEDMQLLSPAFTFATLGGLSLMNLVAVGDFFVRQHRPGVGRRQPGRPPLATVIELGEAVRLGRWSGMQRLRDALRLVREDSWSPRESMTRVLLVRAGLPEPELNVDLFDRSGAFLGCADMVYPRYRVIIEYQGEHHRLRYAEDVERVERMRVAGWSVLQVTKVLLGQPGMLVARVARELRAAGWSGEPSLR